MDVVIGGINEVLINIVVALACIASMILLSIALWMIYEEHIAPRWKLKEYWMIDTAWGRHYHRPHCQMVDHDGYQLVSIKVKRHTMQIGDTKVVVLEAFKYRGRWYAPCPACGQGKAVNEKR